MDRSFDIPSDSLKYLVKGLSVTSKTFVIGFPYVTRTIDENGKEVYYNMINVPVYETGQMESHFISGDMYRFVKMEDGEPVFEDENINDLALRAAVDATNGMNLDTENGVLAAALVMSKFIDGISWAVKNRATEVNFTRKKDGK